MYLAAHLIQYSDSVKQQHVYIIVLALHHHELIRYGF